MTIEELYTAIRLEVQNKLQNLMKTMARQNTVVKVNIQHDKQIIHPAGINPAGDHVKIY